jgi:hypothetical protein
MALLLDTYASKIRTLGVFWFVFAGLRLLGGIAGMTFLRGTMGHHFGPWGHNPWTQGDLGDWWFGPALMHLIWVSVLIKVGLALAAGWGLMERAQWGRFVALVAAFLSILAIPFGTVLAIFTFVLLLGYRNSTLYNQL